MKKVILSVFIVFLASCSNSTSTGSDDNSTDSRSSDNSEINYNINSSALELSTQFDSGPCPILSMDQNFWVTHTQRLENIDVWYTINSIKADGEKYVIEVEEEHQALILESGVPFSGIEWLLDNGGEANLALNTDSDDGTMVEFVLGTLPDGRSYFLDCVSHYQIYERLVFTHGDNIDDVLKDFPGKAGSELVSEYIDLNVDSSIISLSNKNDTCITSEERWPTLEENLAEIDTWYSVESVNSKAGVYTFSFIDADGVSAEVSSEEIKFVGSGYIKNETEVGFGDYYSTKWLLDNDGQVNMAMTETAEGQFEVYEILGTLPDGRSYFIGECKYGMTYLKLKDIHGDNIDEVLKDFPGKTGTELVSEYT